MRPARIEALAAAALAAVAAGLLYVAIPYPADSRIFPILVVGGLLAAAIIWFVRSLVSGRGGDPGEGSHANYRHLLGAAAVTAGYGIAVWLTSYFFPTIVYIPLMAYVLGNRNLGVTIASGAAFTVMIYVIFVAVFERPMPLY